MMKTYEEMAKSALERIRQHQTEQKKRRKQTATIAASAGSLCLAVVLGVGIWQSGAYRTGAPLVEPETRSSDTAAEPFFPAVTDSGFSAEQMADAEHPDAEQVTAAVLLNDPETEPLLTEDEGIVPPGTTEDAVPDSYCYFWWKYKWNVGGPLYRALEEDPDGTFAVTAVYRPAVQKITSFLYEGKTLSELAIAADDERLLPEKMMQLLKMGDELKYGAALYETGTPDGVKWAKSLYEEQIAFFGEELLNRYIADGEFLRDALEKDLAGVPAAAAQETYARAFRAYMEECVLPAAEQRMAEAGIRCERLSGTRYGLTFSVGAEMLEHLPLDDAGSWSLDLASGGLPAGDAVSHDAFVTD